MDKPKMEPLFPRSLRRGDTIALVVPASPVKRERIELAIQRLEEMGFRIKQYGDLYRKLGYLAGDDVTRAEELMAAFADPEVSAVFPARGGTGITRILDMLDYEVIRQNPKIFAGFSDNTALHLALQSQTGLVTIHSPHPMDGMGAPQGLSDLSARTFWRALLEEEYDSWSGGGYVVPLSNQERELVATVFPGVARGRLVGGNLALIGALMGTPYEIETMGNILLLEDVEERPYRIDRFLSQLKLAGKLEGLAGILLGQFTDCQPVEGKSSLTLDEIFHGYFHDLNIPVVQNFPTGHSRDNATLPLNVQVELDADSRTLRILENPVLVAG
ncbi:MAG: LD-carboxypeptidase [Planctomycetales bacterium]|nr:LD-carboxypeptidase [Planctomycetales bacterium]